MRKDQFITQIAAIYPAPGWRVFSCFIDREERPNYYEVPVIGWAVLRPVPLSGEQWRECGDELQLYVFDEYPGTMDDHVSSNSTYRTIAPGQVLDSDGRAGMEAEVRRKLRTRPEAKQLA